MTPKPSQSDASESTRRLPENGARALGILLLTVICLSVGVVAYALNLSRQEVISIQRTLQKLQIDQPVSNRLDTRYRDGDNDLVADLPASSAAWIDPPVLVFSFIATKTPEHYEQVFRDLCQTLSETLGRDVIYRGFTSREDQLRAIRDGEVHLAGLNTGAVPLAVNACGFVPLVCLGTEENASRYRMLLLVADTSEIQSPHDLRGQTITFTDPSSNSGFKAPYAILAGDFGLMPERDYQLDFSLGHENSIRGVADGRYDVVAVASDMFERVVKNGVIQPDQVRVIYESENFPSACIGHIHNLDPELTAALRDALLEFSLKGTSLETEFAGAGISQFQPVNYKNDFALIRRIDDAIGRRHVLE